MSFDSTTFPIRTSVPGDNTFYCLSCMRTVPERYRYSHSNCLQDTAMTCGDCGAPVRSVEELRTSHRLNCAAQALGPGLRQLHAVAARTPPPAVVQCEHCSKFVALPDFTAHQCGVRAAGSTTRPASCRVIMRGRPMAETDLAAAAAASSMNAEARVALKHRLWSMGLLTGDRR